MYHLPWYDEGNCSIGGIQHNRCSQIAILDLSKAISWKRCKIWSNLVLITNRKSIWIKIGDLEWPWTAWWRNLRHFTEFVYNVVWKQLLGLPPRQVSSWCIQPLGHNIPTSQTLRYCSNVAQRKPTKLCTMFGRMGLVHYIGLYIFGGSCPITEFCQVQNSLCVQVLDSPIF